MCSLTRNRRLRNSSEFRQNYQHGKRYDGRLMSVFVRPNNLEIHRLGVTVSRKISLRAVRRNRAKRLLRESFRLNCSSLNNSKQNYDWVINARNGLLNVRMADASKEFKVIIDRVLGDERFSSGDMSRQSQ